MFTSTRARWAAPIVLVAAGAILGAVFATGLHGASPAVAGTTQTRSASCAAINFHPIDSETDYSYQQSERIRTSSEGTGFFICDPGLPNKAVVTKVQFTLEDRVGGGGSPAVEFCGLYRNGLTTSTSDTIQELAAVPSTNQGVIIGRVRRTDDSISNATINNAKHAYWLQCRLGFWAGEHAAIGLWGADVIYQITSTNG